MSFRWVKQQVHLSWHIAALFLGITTGIWLAQFDTLQEAGTLPWVLVAVLVGGFCMLKRWVWLLAGMYIAGTLFGLARGSLVQGELHEYEALYGNTVTIEGVVADDLDTNKRGESVLRLKNVVYNDKELGGMVWVTLADKQPIERSDEVTVRAKIDRGFGTFTGSMYSAELVAAKRAEPGDGALHLRNWFANNVRTVLPEPEASLGVGFLVGQRRALPDELANALKIAGLMHIVVASGYNLTILVRIARRTFAKISKYLATAVSGLLVVGFIAITGMSPSMARAGLVTALSLAAWYYGRTIHPVVLLSLAMGSTTFINPSYVWGDIGWLLSFSSFAGVLLCAPLLQAYYFGARPAGLLRQVVGETVAAWLFTLPILLVIFGTMSNVAVLANLLIVPLIPFAMLATFIAGAAAVVVPALAPIIAFPAHALLSYMVQVAGWTAHLDWAQREVHLEWWHAVACYSALGLFCMYMWYRTRYNIGATSVIE